MKTIVKNRVYLELLILIAGLITWLVNKMWLSDILIYLGLSALVIELVTRLLLKKQNIKILSIIIFVFALINILRHYGFYLYFMPILNEFLKMEYTFYFIQETIWVIPSIFVLYSSIKLMRNKQNIEFSNYIKTKEFKFIFGFVLLSIILDMPVFYFHGDFAGNIHGHGFWDINTHIH